MFVYIISLGAVKLFNINRDYLFWYAEKAARRGAEDGPQGLLIASQGLEAGRLRVEDFPLPTTGEYAGVASPEDALHAEDL